MATLHLIVDEVVPAWKFQYRVRIWRQAGYPPVVLTCQVPDHPPPDWYSSLLGNLVLGSFLGYSVPIPVFFELSTWTSRPGRSASASRLSAATSARSFTSPSTRD